MIKCIATDMDGTLLNRERLISEENKKAFLHAQNQGIDVVIATGRSHKLAKFPLEKAGINAPIICMNGANIYTENGKPILTIKIEKDQLIKIHSILKKADLYYEFYTDQGQFTTKVRKAIKTAKDMMEFDNPSLNLRRMMIAINNHIIKRKVKFKRNIDFLLQDHSPDVYKLIVFSSDPDHFQPVKEKLAKVGDLAISSSGPNNMEITHINAQKGLALERYAYQKGYSLENVAAIGDSYNDVSMLKKAGFSIAMENAPGDIKDIADYVTDSHERDGFAKAIYKVLELNRENEKKQPAPKSLVR